jgi:hypothetical protein
MVMADKAYRTDTRIAVSKPTLYALKSRLRGGETYDTLLRRMLVSGIERPISQMTDEEHNWVLYKALS